MSNTATKPDEIAASYADAHRMISEAASIHVAVPYGANNKEQWTYLDIYRSSAEHLLWEAQVRQKPLLLNVRLSHRDGTLRCFLGPVRPEGVTI